jgi:hypothetical protein
MNDDDLIYEMDGKEYFDAEQILSILLKEEVLFCAFSRDFSYDSLKIGEVYKSGGHSVVLSVLCSDIFAYACADAEDLPYDEIPKLYKEHLRNKKWGSTVWCCIRRNQKPLNKRIEQMKADGAWREELDKLPDNAYESYKA